MRKQLLATLLAGVMVLSTAFTAAAAPESTGEITWKTATGGGYGSMTEGVIKGADTATDGMYKGPTTEFYGYETDFPAYGFTTKVVVDASKMAEGEYFEWSSALNKKDGSAGQDEMVSSFQKNGDVCYYGVGLNATHDDDDAMTGADLGNISIETRFYKDGDNIKATATVKSGSFTGTREKNLGAASTAGGNRYGWFCNVYVQEGITLKSVSLDKNVPNVSVDFGSRTTFIEKALLTDDGNDGVLPKGENVIPDDVKTENAASVSLTAGDVKDAGGKIKVAVEITNTEGKTAQCWADFDSDPSAYYDLVKIAYIGPAQGFTPQENVATTPIYVTGEAGTYHIKVTVTDADDSTVTYATEQKDFTIQPAVTAPAITLTPDKTAYDNGETVSVAISSATDGAALSYKLGDAADWTAYTEAFDVTAPGTEGGTVTVHAKAEKGGASLEESKTITFNAQASATVDKPVITLTPDKTAYDNGETVSVAISSATDGAALSYKLGDAADWTAYTEAFDVTAPGTEGGTVTVHAKAEKDGTSLEESKTITFNAQEVNPPEVTVSSIAVEPKELHLTIGASGESSGKVRATVTMSDGEENDQVDWTSDSPDVAIVRDNGEVTALSEGTARITAAAKEDSSKTDFCTVTVTESGDTPDPDPNPDPEPTPAPTPKPTPGGGGSSGGSGGGSSKNDWWTERDKETVSNSGKNTSSALTADGQVKESAVTKAAKDAVRAAASSGSAAAVTVKNAKSITANTLNALAQTAKDAGGSVTLYSDQIVGGKIESRMYIDPAKAGNISGDIKLGVSLQNRAVQNTFKKFFANEVAVVSFDQKGPFGMEIEVAVKADLSALDQKALKFYVYDSALNSYYQVFPQYYMDVAGFLHFTTAVGDNMIITDSALSLR